MVVISSKTGQLGNRILLFAHFIANAIEYGYQIVNPAFAEYAPLFATTANDWLCRFPSKPKSTKVPASVRSAVYAGAALTARLMRYAPRNPWIRSFRFEDHEASDELDLSSAEFQQMRRAAHTLLVRGWRYRDHSSLWKHRNAVRAFFAPVRTHQAKVDGLITDLRRDGLPLVGIHIRQGDYRTWQAGRYYFELTEYADLMRSMLELFPGHKVRFLVCSNVPPDPDAFRDLDWRTGTGVSLEDMYALAACDYIVGPPSTFSSWASYYGGVPLCRIRSTETRITLSAPVYGYREE